MSKVVEVVTKMAEPVVEEAGCSLWNVEYVKETGGHWFLRVYIDKADGINIEDCERVSRALDPKLDELDVISGQYTFEVSSAGAERQLKRDSDFAQFIGHLVEVKLYRAVSGGKEHVGKLIAYENGDVTIEMVKGKETELRKFLKNDIAMVRLRIA
ncbi:MAG: ribosome maturation factor RimP [Oscillospiraceae bacterium]|nr:ribosome maturation factor RimP [Oscillospiraceae bacterium]